MCDHKNFALCSCNGEKLPFEAIGWILQRKNPQKEIEYVKGEPAQNILTSSEKNTKMEIAQKLNASNCFDFEYQPQEDDFLQIRTGQGKFTWYAYRFVKGKWQEDNSTSFDAWRMELEDYEQGKIK